VLQNCFVGQPVANLILGIKVTQILIILTGFAVVHPMMIAVIMWQLLDMISNDCYRIIKKIHLDMSI
jgi:hypothetical protein